jgi:hypothetical protein
VLRVEAAAGEEVKLPAGEWELLSYTIDHPRIPGKGEKAPKASDGGAKKSPTTISARIPKDAPKVEVAAGKTVELPFGPPYRALVKASPRSSRQATLRLDIVDQGGASCTDLRVEGKRPPNPPFVIFDPSGKVVQRGKFEYG